MNGKRQESGFPAAPERAFRTARTLASALLAGLVIDLAAEEAVRIGLRPFFGLVQLGPGRPAARMAFYAAAAAAIIVIRIVHGILRRPRPGQTPEARLRRVFTATVIALLLAEIPAILGLVLFLLGGYNIDFYMMLFASLVLVYMYYPRRTSWAAGLQEEGATCPF